MSSSLSGATGYRGPTGKNSGTSAIGYNKSIGERGAGPGEYVPSGYRKGQLANFTPEQMTFLQQLMGYLGPESYLGKIGGGDYSELPGGEESFYEQIEAPAYRNFQGLQGQLASRFSAGGLGGRHSSGFQNSMGQMGSDLVKDLASQRSQMQFQREQLKQQAIQELLGLGNSLLNQRPYESILTPKSSKQSFGQQLLGSSLGGFSQGLGSFLGGLV